MVRDAVLPDNGGMSQPSWEDRVLGAIYGAACGDALGAPFDDHGRRPSASDVDAWFDADRPLRWTESTTLVLATAKHLVANLGEIDQDALAGRYADAWVADPNRGYHPAAAKVFADVLAERDWRATSRGVDGGHGSRGSGGAVRATPVGLVSIRSLSRIADLARRSAAITDCHPLGMEGAAVQAVAVALASRSDPSTHLDAAGFLRAIAPHAPSEEYRIRLRTVRSLLGAENDADDVAARLGDGDTAPACVPAALAAFLRNPDDPVAALRFAVRIDGGAGGVAAMVGGMSGARCGVDVFPTSWRQRLQQADRLRSAASILAELRP